MEYLHEKTRLPTTLPISNSRTAQLIPNTDIEQSTAMWEVLPDSVCDSALILHSDVIRNLLDKHRGYECGTEVICLLIERETLEKKRERERGRNKRQM